MRAISIRIDSHLGRQFDEICQETGYKKNTLLTRLIVSFVRHQKKALRGRKKAKDPFLDAIGLMEVEPLLRTPDEIDGIVYDL